MLTEKTIAEIDRQLREGILPNDVAASLGISRATMEKYLMRADYEIEYIPAQRRLRRLHVADLVEAGQ